MSFRRRTAFRYCTMAGAVLMGAEYAPVARAQEPSPVNRVVGLRAAASSSTSDSTLSVEPALHRAYDFTSSRSLIALRNEYDNDVDLAVHAGANALAPGLGFLLDGEIRRGIPYAAAGVSLIAGAVIAHMQPRGESFRNNCLLLYQNVGFLAAWDGYYQGLGKRIQDGDRIVRGRPSKATYLRSPFAPSAVASWEWLAPTSVALALGATFLALEDGDGPPSASSTIGVEALILAQNVMVGTGEELMFRGVVLPELGAWTRSTRKAVLIQALIFGLLHTSPDSSWDENAARFAFSSAFGLYAGWLAVKRPNGLRKAIAVHTWWNTIVFSADYLDDGVAEPIVVRLRF